MERSLLKLYKRAIISKTSMFLKRVVKNYPSWLCLMKMKNKTGDPSLFVLSCLPRFLDPRIMPERPKCWPEIIMLIGNQNRQVDERSYTFQEQLCTFFALLFWKWSSSRQIVHESASFILNLSRGIFSIPRKLTPRVSGCQLPLTLFCK